MRIKDLQWDGLAIWPPQWAQKIPYIIEWGLLRSVEILPHTTLIRIDANYAGAVFSGVIISNEDKLESLYLQLKDNVGKSLRDVGNLEVTF